MRKKIISIAIVLVLTVALTACGKKEDGEGKTQKETMVTENPGELNIEGASYLVLSDEEITLDGKNLTTRKEDAVYADKDIVYYEEGRDFTYGAGSKEDEHSAKEAAAHTVVHITKPGTYVVSGTLAAGQIAVDLGEDAKDDADAVVTLVLNNVDITCSVAPGIIFYNVYECSSDEEEEASMQADTSAAGANVLIADGSVNTVRGSYVAKIYKSVELNDDGTEITDSKKLHKYDGAFYSKMSMNINGGEAGDGVLNIYAENEGLDSELHLTINGGNINIVAGNDGINTNEDNVSVTTINGGCLNIKVDGATGEGDGIDSNGWIVINGGMVNSAACSDSMDAGIDSDRGIYINGGTVTASGNMYDTVEEGNQNYVVFAFMEKVEAGTKVILKKGEEDSLFNITMPNDYTYLVISNPQLEEGTYTLWVGDKQMRVAEAETGFGGPGMGKPDGEPPRMPEGMEEEIPEMPERPEEQEGNEPPRMPEGREEEIPEMPGKQDGNKLPQRPEGQNGELPEDMQHKAPGFMQVDMENAVTRFTIKNGGNMYMAAE